jgi:predicted nucleotidyltransferase
MVAALKRYDPERVILFGSAARGDGDEHSDVDIVLSNSYQLTSIEWRIL